MATPKKSIDQITSDVLSAVDQSRLGNQRELTYTKEAQSDLGKLMQKVAGEMRHEATRELNWDDVQEFRNRYGV